MSELLPIYVDFNRLWRDGDNGGVIGSPTITVPVGCDVLAQDYYDTDLKCRATVVRRNDHGTFLQCHWDAP